MNDATSINSSFGR